MIRSYNDKNDRVEVELLNKLCHPGPVIIESKAIIRITEHGFYAFTSKDDSFEIIRFCVHPDYRSLGIGTVLHLDLLKLAMQHGKKKLLVVIHEESEAISWLRDCWGWVAVEIKKDHFKNRDGYLMERKIIR